MAQVILDLGSGNSCHNSIDYACRMIQTVIDMDSHKHEIIFKFQLFQDEPPNIPLDHLVFGAAYSYAKKRGYKTTSSVFDKESLGFLLGFDVPFVKIACRPRLYWLIGEVPRKIPVYVSWDGKLAAPQGEYVRMFCVPNYPAQISDYGDWAKGPAVSDHTEGLKLWRKYHPEIFEKHFILEDDPTNPDCAGHAIKPDLLKEVIG